MLNGKLNSSKTTQKVHIVQLQTHWDKCLALLCAYIFMHCYTDITDSAGVYLTRLEQSLQFFATPFVVKTHRCHCRRILVFVQTGCLTSTGIHVSSCILLISAQIPTRAQQSMQALFCRFAALIRTRLYEQIFTFLPFYVDSQNNGRLKQKFLC